MVAAGRHTMLLQRSPQEKPHFRQTSQWHRADHAPPPKTRQRQTLDAARKSLMLP